MSLHVISSSPSTHGQCIAVLDSVPHAIQPSRRLLSMCTSTPPQHAHMLDGNCPTTVPHLLLLDCFPFLHTSQTRIQSSRGTGSGACLCYGGQLDKQWLLTQFDGFEPIMNSSTIHTPNIHTPSSTIIYQGLRWILCQILGPGRLHQAGFILGQQHCGFLLPPERPAPASRASVPRDDCTQVPSGAGRMYYTMIDDCTQVPS